MIHFLNNSFLKWKIFLEINIDLWINICTFWAFWTSWHRSSYRFGWGSVSWIWIEGNVFDKGSSVVHFCIRIGYWLCRGCEICLVCYFHFYFWHFRNFLWLFWYLNNSLIKGRGPSSLIPSLPLSYMWCLIVKFFYLLMGPIFCFSGRILGSKLLLMPWTSGSFISAGFCLRSCLY